MDRQLYIVVSQTGTLLSRLLKIITRAEYNHASISLDPRLTTMYSFGRLNPYNPFYGGFVEESPHFGTFKRFKNTRVVVLAVKINEEQYNEIHNKIQHMLYNRNKYHYNYLGLCMAAFRIHLALKNSFYCSEFVKHILETGGISGANELKPIVQPVHFFALPVNTIYRGKLQEYSEHFSKNGQVMII